MVCAGAAICAPSVVSSGASPSAAGVSVSSWVTSAVGLDGAVGSLSAAGTTLGATPSPVIGVCVLGV
jgi:hypothetical protein